MIIEYHRPETLDAALALLSRQDPMTVPLGGGTVLNRPSPEPIAVVDLQALGLDQVEHKSRSFWFGACLTLQAFLTLPAAFASQLPAALFKAVQHEVSYNLRHAATLAGSLVASDGRSPLATALLALDASLQLARSQMKPQTVSLGDLFALRAQKERSGLITQVVLPVGVKLSYQYAARTPADRPIVCAAAAAWPSGRTRLVLGGWGTAPVLVLDGPEPSGIKLAAESACTQAEDEWASAAYRQHTAGVLAQRCLAELTKGEF